MWLGEIRLLKGWNKWNRIKQINKVRVKKK